MTDSARDGRFRFGVVSAHARDGDDWAAQARRVEELGFDCLLVPDTARTLAPLIAAAVAGSATSRLRVGSFVLAAPLRPAGMVAWEAATLQQLTGGRFELGLGTGRPQAAADAAALGAAFGTPAERIAQVVATIEAVRARPGAPRILVAASGPRMLELAADLADTIAFGLPPTADDDRLGAAVDVVRKAAGDGFDRLELSINLLAAGTLEQTPDWLRQQLGTDVATLAAAGSYAVLAGAPAQ